MRIQLTENGEAFCTHSEADLVEAMLTGKLRMIGCLNAAEVAPSMLECLTEVGHFSTFEGPDDLEIIATAV